MAEEQTKKSNKKVVAGVIALAAAVAVLAAVFLVCRPKPTQGAKAVTIEVVDKSQNSTAYSVHTDAEFLRQAMEEADGLEFSGDESEYGLYLKTVNGITADYSVDASWWGLYDGDEMCNYGIDSQPVEDGHTYKIVYTISE